MKFFLVLVLVASWSHVGGNASVPGITTVGPFETKAACETAAHISEQKLRGNVAAFCLDGQ